MLFWMVWTPFAIGVLVLTLTFIMNVLELELVEFLFFGSGTALLCYLMLVPFLY
jgi:hypothetical protein